MLKKFDIFGTYPKFYHEGQGIYQTYVGSFLTILLLGSAVLSCFYYGKEIYEKENPQTIYSEEYNQSPDKYVFKKDKFSIALSLQNFVYADEYPNMHYIDESVYQLTLYNAVQLNKKNSTTGETYTINEDKVIPMEKCTKEDFQVEGTESYFTNLSYVNHLYCVKDYDMHSFDMEGDFGQDRYSRLEFKFRECKNSTDSDIICKPKEDIDRILQTSYMAVYYTDEVIQPKNYTYPFQHIGRDAFYSVSNQQLKQIDFNFRNTYMVSNNGLIWDNIYTESTIVKSQEFQQIFTSQDDRGTFLNFTFRFEKIKQNKYYRTYLNLATVLAQVGGILKIIFLLFWLISYFFSSRDLDLSILNQIFCFKYEQPQNNTNNPSKKNNQKTKNSEDLEKKKKQNQSENFQLKQFMKNMKEKLKLNTVKSFFHTKMLDEAEKEQKELFNIAHYKLKNELDFIRIIKKVQEIDKIKALLLNEDQIQLFEEISKTVISKKDKEEYRQKIHNYQDIVNDETQQNKKQKQISNKQIKDIEQEIHFKKSFLSFKRIQQKEKKSITDQKVLQLMDPQVLHTFLDISKSENYVNKIQTQVLAASKVISDTNDNIQNINNLSNRQNISQINSQIQTQRQNQSFTNLMNKNNQQSISYIQNQDQNLEEKSLDDIEYDQQYQQLQFQKQTSNTLEIFSPVKQTKRNSNISSTRFSGLANRNTRNSSEFQIYTKKNSNDDNKPQKQLSYQQLQQMSIEYSTINNNISNIEQKNTQSSIKNFNYTQNVDKFIDQKQKTNQSSSQNNTPPKRNSKYRITSSIDGAQKQIFSKSFTGDNNEEIQFQNNDQQQKQFQKNSDF